MHSARPAARSCGIAAFGQHHALAGRNIRVLHLALILAPRIPHLRMERFAWSSGSTKAIPTSRHRYNLSPRCSIQMFIPMASYAWTFFRIAGAPAMMFPQYWQVSSRFCTIQIQTALLTHTRPNFTWKTAKNTWSALKKPSNNPGLMQMMSAKCCPIRLTEPVLRSSLQTKARKILNNPLNITKLMYIIFQASDHLSSVYPQQICDF